MDVVSLCPLRVGSLVWQPRRGAWALTAVCKATYALAPGESPLAPEQEYPNEDDNHWNDDPARSLYSPADLVPFKTRADVMLVGHAFAARKEPVRSLVARLIVGEVNKAIECWGDRSWTQDGSLREGPRFLKMPLRYERASGGPDTSNPVGVRLDARPDVYGSQPLPNLQPTGLALASPKDFIEPICFGPIAWTWPSRRSRLARHAAGWSAAWVQEPLPEDLDPAFFNAAPRDQQLDAIRPNERIVLENLHPEHARLGTNLPGTTPRAFVERRGAAAQEVQLVCDTLWIDTDRGICTLTWRAQIPIEHPAQPGRVLIALAEPGQRLAWADVERLAGSIEPEVAEPRPHAPVRMMSDALGLTPYVDPPRGPRPSSALPFLASASAPEIPIGVPEPPRPRRSRPQGDPLGQTHDEVLSSGPPSAGRALPFGLGSPSAASGSPPWLTQSRLVAPPAAGATPIPGAPFGNPPATLPLYAQQPIQVPAAPTFSPPPFDAGPPEPAALPTPLPPPVMATAKAASVVPAAPPTFASRGGTSRAREVVDLLWFDPSALPRVRAHEAWKRLVGASSPQPDDRRDVSAVLARGEAIEPEDVSDAISAAIGDDGSFLPPLVLTRGDLSFSFDELAMLRATVAAVRPFAGADHRLKELVDSAGELLSGDAQEAPIGATEGLLARLRECFQQQSRTAPPGYLDAQTERTLLEQRRYQRRLVLGASRLRAVLTAAASGSPAVPVYLPEALAHRLPMFQRFRARLIAEAHLQQDQYETSPAALQVVAVARVMRLGAGTGERR